MDLWCWPRLGRADGEYGSSSGRTIAKVPTDLSCQVERVTKSSSLGEYFERNIWQPLGLEDTTFRVSKNPEMLQNLVELTMRKPDGTLVPGSHIPRDPNAEFESGGAGIYGTPSDFVRFVAEIVNDGGVLLKPATVHEMFTPQLKDDQYLHEALRKSCAGAGLNISPNFKDPKMKIQHGLSFLINMQPLSTGRPSGSGQYGGAANTFWVCPIPFVQVILK